MTLLRGLLEEYGLADVAIVKDYAGKDRCAAGILSVKYRARNDFEQHKHRGGKAEGAWVS